MNGHSLVSDISAELEAQKGDSWSISYRPTAKPVPKARVSGSSEERVLFTR